MITVFTLFLIQTLFLSMWQTFLYLLFYHVTVKWWSKSMINCRRWSRYDYFKKNQCRQGHRKLQKSGVAFMGGIRFLNDCQKNIITFIPHQPSSAFPITHSERRPQIFIPKRKSMKPLLYHQIGNINLNLFSLQISKTMMFCVDKIKYEHLAILSNLQKVANLHLK